MSSAEYTNKAQRHKSNFQSTNSALRNDWNQEFNTVSRKVASSMKESPNKDFYQLNSVPEDHHTPQSPFVSPTSSTTPTTPPNSSSSPFSNKSVFRKPNFFNKRDPPSSSLSNQSSKSFKTPGKVKNFIYSIRQRSKSSSTDLSPNISSINELFVNDNVFTNEGKLEEEILNLTLGDNQLNNQNNNNNNNNKYIYNNHNNNININKITGQNGSSSSSSNNNNNNNNDDDVINSIDIGPDQYLAYHRDRTQSDTTRFLVARKQARDQLTKSPSNRTRLNSTRHHSACLDEGNSSLDTRLLVWRDPRVGTKVYRMPSNSQRWPDSDDSPTLVYSKLLADHCCYDLVPTSSKIVVIDSRLSIKKAFLVLAKDGVKASIVWHSPTQSLSSMLTITDFIRILYSYYSSCEDKNLDDLENDSIGKWKGQSNGIISCAPEETVLNALKLFCQHRVHRLLILDKRLGNAINVLTHKRILAFINFYMPSIDPPPFLHHPLSSFPVITIGKVTTITYDTKLAEALKLFIEERISAVPVVDEEGCLVNIFAKYDFSRLAYDKLYSNLERPVRDVILLKSQSHVDMHTAQPDIPLSKAVQQIVTASVHRLILVDDDRKVVGMATLTDLLRCLVLEHEDDKK